MIPFLLSTELFKEGTPPKNKCLISVYSWELIDCSWFNSFGVWNRGYIVLSWILYGASIIFTPGISTSSKSYEGMSWYFPAYLHSMLINVCLPVLDLPAMKIEIV